MGRNRVIGAPLQTQPILSPGGPSEPINLSFTTNRAVDLYPVATNEATGPVDVTLDPGAVIGDQVTIQDAGGAASTNNIVINASQGQSIAVGAMKVSQIVIHTNFGGLLLTLCRLGQQLVWLPTLAPVASASPV